MGRSRNDGRGKTGGRKPGTPNKVSSDLKQWVRDILESGREQFQEDLMMLEPAERVKAYISLLAYTTPKMAPVSTKEQMREEKEMLQELLLEVPELFIDKIADRIIKLKGKEENDSEI